MDREVGNTICSQGLSEALKRVSERPALQFRTARTKLLSAFTAMLGRVAAGEDLSREEMAAAIELIIGGDEAVSRPTDAQVGLLLTSLRAKGETFAEVAGAAEALRRRMVRVRTRHEGLIGPVSLPEKF